MTSRLGALLKYILGVLSFVIMATESEARKRFSFNGRKAVESILWLANQRPGKVDKYRLLKACYLADVYHLNAYGRPVCGDFPVAMKHGPVPSKMYDMLKLDTPVNKRAIEKGDAPPFTYDKKTHVVAALRGPDLDHLSESDLEALQSGWDTVKDLTFDEIHDVGVKNNPVYATAWAGRGIKESVDMDPLALVENEELRKDLSEMGPFMRI